MRQNNALALNCGSTSIKFKLFDDQQQELESGHLEQVADFDKGLKDVLRQIVSHGTITAVLHRIVHGGSRFRDPVIVTDEIMAELEMLAPLAPLHNPFNLAGIRAANGFLPEARQIGIFDTGFYKHLPAVASIYPISHDLTERYGLFRFGFHGLSHQYVMHEAQKELGLSHAPTIITIHLGGGGSVTAIKQGKPIETSMGYTPNEGLIMMTRSGDIDSDLVLDLLEKLPGEINASKAAEVRSLLNRESGISAIVGHADFQTLLRDANLGKPEASFAFDLFMHRLVKYVGGYHLLLEGKTEAVILTGGIGAGNSHTREALQVRLRSLQLPIIAIRTDEELMMARLAKENNLL